MIFITSSRICIIEECLYRVMSGILIDGLNTVRAYQRDTMMPLKDILEGLASGKFLMYDAVTALLLGYGKFGTLKCDTKNPEERDSEPVEWINKARRYVDQILYASSTKRRLLGVHLTFLTLWPIVKEKLLRCRLMMIRRWIARHPVICVPVVRILPAKERLLVR